MQHPNDLSQQSSYIEMESSHQPNDENRCKEEDKNSRIVETTSIPYHSLGATTNSYKDQDKTARDAEIMNLPSLTINSSTDARIAQLTHLEVKKLRNLLQYYDEKNLNSCKNNFFDERPESIKRIDSTGSDYPGYGDSTHSWAVFADTPQKRASKKDRFVGVVIIAFQLFTYYLFAAEAIEDYERGQVPVRTLHSDCVMYNEQPEGNFFCEAEFTNGVDAFAAFFMLGIFLAGDFIKTYSVIRMAPFGFPLLFACLTALEIVAAFIAASIAISYNLYIGEVTDAIEVGVGLLFIRELSQKAYEGIRDGKRQRKHSTFFMVLAALVGFGMFMDHIWESLFATKERWFSDLTHQRAFSYPT